MNIVTTDSARDINKEHCTVCRDEGLLEVKAVCTVQGGVDCGYCGNAINLCRKHLRQAYRELKAVHEVWS
jgi:hypothetical protein